jgi:hypothetical protein
MTGPTSVDWVDEMILIMNDIAGWTPQLRDRTIDQLASDSGDEHRPRTGFARRV